jgi:hypothetical protein
MASHSSQTHHPGHHTHMCASAPPFSRITASTESSHSAVMTLDRRWGGCPSSAERSILAPKRRLRTTSCRRASYAPVFSDGCAMTALSGTATRAPGLAQGFLTFACATLQSTVLHAPRIISFVIGSSRDRVPRLGMPFPSTPWESIPKRHCARPHRASTIDLSQNHATAQAMPTLFCCHRRPTRCAARAML